MWAIGSPLLPPMPFLDCIAIFHNLTAQYYCYSSGCCANRKVSSSFDRSCQKRSTSMGAATILTNFPPNYFQPLDPPFHPTTSSVTYVYFVLFAGHTHMSSLTHIFVDNCNWFEELIMFRLLQLPRE